MNISITYRVWALIYLFRDVYTTILQLWHRGGARSRDKGSLDNPGCVRFIPERSKQQLADKRVTAQCNAGPHTERVCSIVSVVTVSGEGQDTQGKRPGFK
jgi:hypothetical protein